MSRPKHYRLVHQQVHDRYFPDFSNLGSFLVLLILGEIFALVLSLASVSSVSAFWQELGLNSLISLFVITICQALFAMGYRVLCSMSDIGAGIIVLSCVMIVSGLVSLITYHYIELGFDLSGDFSIKFQALSNVILVGLATSVGLRYQYIQYQRRLQARAESAARIEALQARMKPHFLFNSLNALANLVRKDPGMAEGMILDLAEVFRAILKKDTQLTSLQQEIELSKQYLNIEKIRLGERLQVDWFLDEEMLGALIPPLSLQPLIENAIRHGIEPNPDGGRLYIACHPDHLQKIVLSVRNTTNEATGSSAGNRMALDNLRSRLRSFFGEEGKLLNCIIDGDYVVRIVIPYTVMRDHENLIG